MDNRGLVSEQRWWASTSGLGIWLVRTSLRETMDVSLWLYQIIHKWNPRIYLNVPG
jgi:hypothetical protein